MLCAVETTLDPTRVLFEGAARTTGARVEVRLVPGAWAAFKAGEHDRYLAMIARAADEAARGGASRVALAQASMAGASIAGAAVPGTTVPPPLAVPAAALRAAVAAAKRTDAGER